MKKREGTALLDATNEYEYDANLTDMINSTLFASLERRLNVSLCSVCLC